MTGGHVNGILEAVKRHALAHFSSNHAVSFTPVLSTLPRNHKLK